MTKKSKLKHIKRCQVLEYEMEFEIKKNNLHQIVLYNLCMTQIRTKQYKLKNVRPMSNTRLLYGLLGYDNWKAPDYDTRIRHIL